jgi:hypothetical protein
MVRTSLSALGRLMQVQAERHKREAIDGAANGDAWALHIAERSTLTVVDPDAGPRLATWFGATPVEAPPACMDQRIAENVSKYGAYSHDTAFETRLNTQPWNRRSTGSGATDLQAVVREAITGSHVAGPKSPAPIVPPGVV